MAIVLKYAKALGFDKVILLRDHTGLYKNTA